MTHPPQEGQILVGPLFSEPMRVTEDGRDCHWLCVVTKCATTPVLYEHRKDPAAIDWHEMPSVAHAYVTMDALKRPIGFNERPRAPFARTS
jgi:hypothetical protein